MLDISKLFIFLFIGSNKIFLIETIMVVMLVIIIANSLTISNIYSKFYHLQKKSFQILFNYFFNIALSNANAIFNMQEFLIGNKPNLDSPPKQSLRLSSDLLFCKQCS